MSGTIDTCMILAAGMGNRMRPLTNDMPKPLITAAGKTLLDHALDTAAHAGLSRAVVNVHYLPEQVEAHLARRAGLPRVDVSDERGVLLETGGGVLKALPLINRATFMVFNADNVWLDGPAPTARGVLDAWQPDKMDALLLLAPTATAVGYDGPGDFDLDGQHHLVRRGGAISAPYVYAGIHILKSQLFDGMAAAPFSLNRVWNVAADTNRLFGIVHPGQWYHVGTPEGVVLANVGLAPERLANAGLTST
jgi:N-acetyl-alpha-D-muramate 1-phosphate uridylyltransferase